MVKWVRVLLVEEGKAPEVCELPNNLKALELTVQGYLEMIEINRSGCVVIYNGINKLTEKPVTRAEIKGTFIIARVKPPELESLSIQDIEILSKVYS
ncbi:MAG: hypothetical protein APF81_18470 [Desulfosporosinus sp. BRH_c37]|nr:MAG: hypothetical protein APF81_18470 [Desulfosporosinus sp. BRH_c37]